jgi:hypothetical protein
MTPSSLLKFIPTSVLFTILTILLPINALTQDIVWKKNFGGGIRTTYNAVIGVPEGIITVVYGVGFGFGDFEGLTGKGSTDALIVKYNEEGEVVWKKNFGGMGSDLYHSVAQVPDGIVAVGISAGISFGNGDWEGVTNKGYDDAIIVKYDHSGNVVWKRNFGGNGADRLVSVTAVSDGVVAVGESTWSSFGSGDWEDVEGRGHYDAIIVKYDHNGNLMWKRNFGGSDMDWFKSVIALPDGVIAVGSSSENSFGNGDWVGIEGKGGGDGILVKYDNNGNIVWKKHFGGSSGDGFRSVITVPDGIVVVGESYGRSFGNGDWEGFTAKGDWVPDAIIVKFDFVGNVVWKNNFGGSGQDRFNSVTQVSDGLIVVGDSFFASFNTGDWEGVSSKGGIVDAVIVKFDNAGNVVWKNNFGGAGEDTYASVTRVSNSVIAVGYSTDESFGNGDWEGVANKSVVSDAIFVKYTTGGVGIPEHEQDFSEIKIYPNPTSGELRITNYELGIRNIEIFDVYGRIHQQENRKSEIGKSEIEMNISHLNTGIYFVKINTDAGVVVKKVVKQ